MTKIIQAGTVLTLNDRGDILKDAAITIEKDRIVRIAPEKETPSISAAEVIDARRYVVLPGFVQTHVHLCQTLFRGMADDLLLLDWLRLKIFPFEAAHNERSMYCSSMLGIAELIRSGTTTILDMGSVHHEEEVIRALGETGMRAFVGKAMMDTNDLYPPLKESTKESLVSTRSLAERWHNSYDGRIKYAVAPRFVLSCTDALMKGAHEMMQSFDGMLFHTHASENTVEIQSVRERCKMENVEFLHHLGLLSEKSCLAHCIHLNENELSILKNTRSNIAHCPSSNLKLGSGIANVPHLLNQQINVSLGADGAPCNNNLNMFQEMRLASLLQKPLHGPTAMPATTVLQMATRNGARALGLANDIGSLEPGKKADLVLLDLKDCSNPVGNEFYSAIVYSAGPDNVDSVMIDGSWVYRKKMFVGIDEERLLQNSRGELEKLLHRVSSLT
jgi:5-methylthioadenosine/S-adenosylhomocysteine deaminase